VIGTLGGDSYGKSEDDETPQSGFLEEAQREPVESVRLAWRSRCPSNPNVLIYSSFTSLRDGFT